MNDLAKSGNLVEAFVWFGFTLVFLVKSAIGDGRLTWLHLILSFAFLVFGVSDLIEMRTGAWWRPWWLLAMKASCLSVFACGIWKYHRIGKSDQPA